MAVVIGAGLSTDPDPRTGAVTAGAIARQTLGDRHADIAIVFGAGAHVEVPEACLDGIREALEPDALIGCGAAGVLANGEEVEEGTGVSVWAASFGDGGGSARTFRAEAVEEEDETTLVGLPEVEDPSAVVLLPDPLHFPVERALQDLAARAPGVPVLGGLASARDRAGGVPLFHGDEVVTGGAVGVVFTGVEVLPCVSQGAAPVGPELTVTAADEHVILELAGRPALVALQEAIDSLDTVDRALVSGGLLLGIVVDPDKPDYQQGDFLVRGLLGADPATGAVAVGYDVRPGQVVRLHARDGGSADRDLRSQLGMHRAALGGEPPAGALVFSCNGRGTGMFGEPGHDAAALARELHDPPAAGFFAAGEIGPVGGHPELHGFTATMAVFPR